MKKIVGIILASFMAFAAFAFVACGTEPMSVEAETYVTLSINPAAEFMVGANGNVEAVNALNEDAEILLSDVNLVGMNMEEAAEKFVDMASENGYINANAGEIDPNLVRYGVVSGGQETLGEAIRQRINNYFAEHGIYGAAHAEDLETMRTAAEELGVSLGKYKLINRVLEIMDDYVAADLASMEMKDLIALLGNNLKQEGFGTLKDEFKQSREALKLEYAEMFGLEDQIEDLQAQIEEFNGTPEDLLALQNELASLTSQYEPLHQAFMAEVEALRNEYQTQFQALKQTMQTQKQQLKAQFSQQYQERKNGVSNAVENTIREWINNRQNNFD